MGNRYGMFKYGSEKYGSSGNENLIWAVEIDWDSDGIFDGTNEGTYLTGLAVTRGRQYIVKEDGSGYESILSGRADLTLENSTRRFDPWNIYGPLFGKLGTGRKARVTVFYKGIGYPVFAGYISDIQPISGDDRRVSITILDGKQYLDENDVSVAIQENISFGQGVDQLLDAVDWPEIWGRTIDTGIAELTYWWVDGEKAGPAIQALADSNLGIFFVAADGKAKFYSRNHISPSVLTVHEDELNREISIPYPWEVVRNSIRIISHTLTEQATSDLWSLGEIPVIMPGETLALFASYAHGGTECAAIHVLDPEAITDYLGNADAAGTSTDLTGSMSITTTKWSKTAKLEIKNIGVDPLYPTLLKIRGNAIIETSNVTVGAEDLESQTDYGKRSFSLDTPWMQNINNATAFANMIKAGMALPRAFPNVQLEGRPELQFVPDLFDAVTLDLPNAGIIEDYRLGRIEHKWLDENGQSVQTIWKLETFSNLNEDAWIFPTRIGVSSMFGF